MVSHITETPLFIQELVKFNIYENIKTSPYSLFVGGIPVDKMLPSYYGVEEAIGVRTIYVP